MKWHESHPGFICRFCRHAVEDKASYLKHLDLHNDKDEFACVLCEKIFTNIRNVRIHVRTTVSKPLDCLLYGTNQTNDLITFLFNFLDFIKFFRCSMVKPNICATYVERNFLREHAYEYIKLITMKDNQKSVLNVPKPLSANNIWKDTLNDT